jgi:hypothetical protein
MAGASIKAVISKAFSGTTNNMPTDLVFSVHADDNAAGPAEAMRIVRDGTIGIGTTTPSGLLHLNIGAAATKGLIVQAASSQSANMQEWNDSSGNILARMASNGTFVSDRGISSGVRLDGSVITVTSGNGNTISATANAGYAIYGNSSNSSGATIFGQNISGIGVQGYSTNGGAGVYGRGHNSSGAVIGYDDNIGIGGLFYVGAAAGIPLVARGTTTQSGDYFQIRSVNATGGDILAINSSGSLGIGTTTPSAKLAITGTAGTGDIFAIASSTDARLLTVTSAGRLGVGTTSPAGLITGSSAANAPLLVLQRTTAQASNIFEVRNPGSDAAYNLRFFMDGGGGLVLNPSNSYYGNTSATGVFDVNLKSAGESSKLASVILRDGSEVGSTGLKYPLRIIGNSQSGTGNTGILFSSENNTDLYKTAIVKGVTETTYGRSTLYFMQSDRADTSALTLADTALAITPSKLVGIGTTTPLYRFEVASSTSGNYVARIVNTANTTTAHGLLVQAGDDTTGGATFVSFARSNGTQIGSVTQNSTTGVLYNTTSDRRLKENIIDTRFGLSDLMKIKVDDYNFISDTQKRTSTGIIAQELYEIFPEAVSKPSDETTGQWAIDYGRITPLIIKSVQDLVGEFRTLVDKVEGGITYLKDIAVKTLRVGSPDKPTGITMYDEVTGDPYCLKIQNAHIVTTMGACGTVGSVPAPAAIPQIPVNNPAPTGSEGTSENNPPVAAVGAAGLRAGLFRA